jgi:protein-S-isoprenylcysteine O-methyltransferase Ste14
VAIVSACPAALESAGESSAGSSMVLRLVPTVLMVQKVVIVPEERCLRRRFDAEYEAYTRRVRRWL